MARRDQTLYRDSEDKKIAGVCSGLAHYFDVDTALVRVIFVAVAMLGGGSVIAYILLWWLIDPAPEGHWDTTPESLADTPTETLAAPSGATTGPIATTRDEPAAATSGDPAGVPDVTQPTS